MSNDPFCANCKNSTVPCCRHTDHGTYSRKRIPYTCPVCSGQGCVWTPPGIPGDQPTYMTFDIRTYPCHACSGSGIVWDDQ